MVSALSFSMASPMKPSTLTPPAVLISKLLDLHLSRAIAREHLKDRVMRKFVQLADDVESDLKSLDNDADELDRRRRETRESARQVVNDHHRIQDRIEEGIAAMRRVAEAAGLPNSRTAAELAAIAADETAAKGNSALGEASGDMPPAATFPKAAE